MPFLTRRRFLQGVGATAAAALLGSPAKRKLLAAHAEGQQHHLYVARNGTPATNVQQAIALAGGIERFIETDDVVVLKPNGQWPRQGYTHTGCLKGLIDAILDRPGGFGGEVIIVEHVHRGPDESLSGDYCWNVSAGPNRSNNWPDMSYFELVDFYHGEGFPNVTANPLYDSTQSDDWVPVTDPGSLPAGKQGWVRHTYTAAASGRTVWLAHPILRSSYSGKLVDLKNGVWEGGGYNGQQVKLIFLPTLNNHGTYGNEDYAGPTSALKCHLGIVEFAGASGGVTLHQVGYSVGRADAVGEAVGHLITQILSPTFYLTCAEYTGYRSRTDITAAHTRIVGLCADPVTLDYWMCKYVMWPCAPSQTFMNPDNDNNLRKTLTGCHSLGVGTLDESEMVVHQVDLSQRRRYYLPFVVQEQA
jgi:hypothetical protein